MGFRGLVLGFRGPSGRCGSNTDPSFAAEVRGGSGCDKIRLMHKIRHDTNSVNPLKGVTGTFWGYIGGRKA